MLDPSPASIEDASPPRRRTAAPIEPLLLDLRQASAATSMSTRWLRRAADLGWPPARRVGRRLLFCAADLRKWIADGCPEAALPKPRAKSR